MKIQARYVGRTIPPLALSLILWPLIAVHAGVLDDVEHRVKDSVRGGKTPVVIFDIDDTLVTTDRRKWMAMREVAADISIQQRFPGEAAAALTIALEQTRRVYDVRKALRKAGIANEEFLNVLSPLWLKIFLSAKYIPEDEEVPGAARYVRRLYDAGAVLIYLTGRDEPNMGDATRASLGRFGFPIAPPSRVILKPDANEPDLDFKKRVFGGIARLGEVVAGFENEPANANAFVDRFSNMTAVFLQTQHSDKPVKPYPSISQIPDYLP